VSQKDCSSLQNCGGAAPAVVWQAASARSSAVALSRPDRPADAGRAGLGIEIDGKHSR